MPEPLSCERQVGVGLIEVLVALLILSIGLLGISLVQARALNSNNSSMGRSMAVVASYSILEAMRADRANALAGTYNQTVIADDDCTIASTTTLAATQLANWCADLRSTLGAATTTTGTVACSGGGDCTITILFDDSRIGAGGSGTMQVLTRAIL